MADIAAQPFINYGASIASQENTEANTGLVGQQTQAAAMQNQIQRASMPLIMKALSDATADQSGSNPGTPSPGAAAARADQSGFNYDDHMDNLEDTLRTQNYVAPYTPQELKMLQASKSLSIADPARGKAMFDMMNANREARMSTQTSQNQLRMGNIYDTATSVATKGPGAFKALLAADPQDAATINPAAAKSLLAGDGNVEPSADDDAKATKYAQHLAAVSHLYSGRPTKMENGQLVDERTGQAVTGRDQLFTGLTGEQRQKEFDRATDQVEWTTPDNVVHKDERWKAPVAYGGYGGRLTPAQAVLTADQAARHAPDVTASTPPGVIPNAAAASTAAPSHGAAAAARVNAKNNAPSPASSADVAAGKAPATGTDTGTLPGVNPASLPKMQSPVAGQGPGTAGTVGTKTQEAIAARNDEEIKTAKSAYNDAQTMRSQITQAKAELAKIDPRTVGPGSGLYNAALKFYTAAAGNAPNALVDETVLDKFLNQIGASNVRSLLAGQRITNQEMMTFLTRGSPSTAMPLGGITHLLNYLDADNEYSLRYNRTKTMALKSGADPDLVDQELSRRINRSDFVAHKTGSGDTLGGSGGAGAGEITSIASAEDYAKVPPGHQYRDPQGNVRTKPR